jgi:hypothetical protein
MASVNIVLKVGVENVEKRSATEVTIINSKKISKIAGSICQAKVPRI